MLSKEEKDLAEKVVTGGGATGQSQTADPVAKTATLPNSKKQGDAMQKINDPAGTAVTETDPENNTAPTGDNSAKNKASVATGEETELSYRDDLRALFGEDVSEEFINDAAALFEAAVALKVDALEEAYQELLAQEIETVREELAGKVDEYLSYMAEEWINENEVAVESSLKSELTEEFITDLKRVFEEHYIDLPTEKVDVVESLSAKVEELEAKLNDSIHNSMQLKNQIEQYEMQEAFEEVSEGLALTQVEKFRVIAENIEFDGVETFKKKLETIKEHYFTGKKVSDSNVLTEEFEGEVESSAAPVATGEMALYVDAIRKTLKK